MVVNFHVGAESSFAIVFYDNQDAARGEDLRFHIEGVSMISVADLEVDRWVYSAVLDGLQPNSTYYFAAAVSSGTSRVLKFRTLPADDGPVTFVVGGDMGVTLTASRVAFSCVEVGSCY